MPVAPKIGMTNKKASNTGRPPITVDSLPKGWEKKIKGLSKVGASIVELAVELEIGRTTLYELCKRDAKFANTLKECKRFSEAWWMKQGRTQLDNKEFSFTGWYMNMKNRFGWTDKKEIDFGEKTLPAIKLAYKIDEPIDE